MMYDWFIRDWATQYIKPVLRRVRNVAYVYCLLKPVEILHTDFLAKKKDIERRLNYNSQQKVFAALLNNLFDNSLRRITILTNDDLIVRKYIYNRTEVIEPVKQVYIRKRSEPGADVIVYKRAEASAHVSFTVNVPSAILPAIEQQLIAEIEYYRLSGKTYKIQAI